MRTRNRRRNRRTRKWSKGRASVASRRRSSGFSPKKGQKRESNQTGLVPGQEKRKTLFESVGWVSRGMFVLFASGRKAYLYQRCFISGIKRMVSISLWVLSRPWYYALYLQVEGRRSPVKGVPKNRLPTSSLFFENSPFLPTGSQVPTMADVVPRSWQTTREREANGMIILHRWAALSGKDLEHGI